MKATKTIRQLVLISATPKDVYATLLDSKKHSQFTGEKAKITKKVGGKFTCYDGYINGVNLELEPGKMITQAWRCQDWPKGMYSLVTFKLTTASKGKTKLEFTQVGVPADDYKDKTQGWKNCYWTPLNEYLANK